MSFKTGIILLSILSCLWTISGCSGKRHISTPITIDKNAITDVVYGNNNDWKGNSTSLTMDIYSPPVMQEGKSIRLYCLYMGAAI